MGLGLRDAYRCFDQLTSGQLSCTELLAAARFLQIPVSPEEIQELVQLIDRDHDGVVSYPEFEAAFGEYESDEDKSDGSDDDDDDDAKTQLTKKRLIRSSTRDRKSAPPPVKLSEADALRLKNELKKAAKTKFSVPTLADITVDVVVSSPSAGSCVKLWESTVAVGAKKARSSGKLSIWDCKLPPDKPAEECLSLGHMTYAGGVELDKNDHIWTYVKVSSQFLKNPVVRRIVDAMLPMPQGFDLVFFIDDIQLGFKKKIWIWKPVPADSNSVALGMLATTTKTPPPRKDVRCVHRALLKTIRKSRRGDNKDIWACLEPKAKFCSLQDRPGVLWSSSSSELLYYGEKNMPLTPSLKFQGMMWKFQIDTERELRRRSAVQDLDITYSKKTDMRRMIKEALAVQRERIERKNNKYDQKNLQDDIAGSNMQPSGMSQGRRSRQGSHSRSGSRGRRRSGAADDDDEKKCSMM